MTLLPFIRSQWRMLRLSVYFFCVSMILSALAARALHAHVKNAARALGHELDGLSVFTRGAETVQLNGARFHHAVLTVEQSVSTVLDEEEAHCQKNTGLFTSTMRELEARHSDVLDQHPELGAFRRGVFRDESECGGALVCFLGQGQSGLSGLVHAAERFMVTSNVSEFGFVRDATAERKKGPAVTTGPWNRGSAISFPTTRVTCSARPLTRPLARATKTRGTRRKATSPTPRATTGWTSSRPRLRSQSHRLRWRRLHSDLGLQHRELLAEKH